MPLRRTYQARAMRLEICGRLPGRFSLHGGTSANHTGNSTPGAKPPRKRVATALAGIGRGRAVTSRVGIPRLEGSSRWSAPGSAVPGLAWRVGYLLRGETVARSDAQEATKQRQVRKDALKLRPSSSATSRRSASSGRSLGSTRPLGKSHTSGNRRRPEDR